MISHQMRFHVLGIGPIGTLVSYHLRTNIPTVNPITLIHKTHRQARESATVSVECHGVVSSVSGFDTEIFDSPTVTQNSELIESLIITTKAHHTIPAISRLLHRLSRNSTITLLQNGMGIYEQLVYDVFRNPEQRPHFILATNTHGAWFKRIRTVVHAGIGEIQFALVSDPGGRVFEAGLFDESVPKHERKLRLNDICDPSNDPSLSRYRSLRNTVAALSSLQSTLYTSWVPMSDLQVAMRRKLVVNAVINPLTAIMGCRNGEIFKTYASHRIMQRVCDEASSAFEAQIRSDTQTILENLQDQDASVPVGRLPRALTTDSLVEECFRVAELTKGNVSSMLADIRKGNNTEIEFVNGYLLNIGSTYKVQMPATATLLNLVKMRTAIPLDQILPQ
jgi:2-dehydropantoate 2-reductase